MDKEILNALLRVLPFLLLILGIGVGIRRKKFAIGELYIQPPNSFVRMFLCWLLFVAFMFVCEVTLYNLDQLKVRPWKDQLVPSIIKIAGMVIFAPIAEELAFRGVILSRLRKWKVNKHVAIIIQAMIFVIVHTGAFDNTLASNLAILQRFTDAIIFAYAMYYTNSIYTPILLHASGNGVAVLEQFVL